MNYLEEVHAVKCGIYSLVTLIIGCGMQHSVIDEAVVISVDSLSQEEEIRLHAVGKTP